ncbi:DUF1571 domain-containing protein [Urbifossiella limnaea]|uniref:DUF1571 domain-containing protein n=1 Tax=Urbifossiella limnaea TaxID=2528023 RepID=A0A517XUY2_9BACT|nr:DUF1571 domain-containing protein [Urbifossiella limnaea]QDU21305.1 hypothetical protein ETAA1_32710 [Urbifossiella limnaea]
MSRRFVRSVAVGLCLMGVGAASCALWPSSQPVEVDPPHGPRMEPPPLDEEFAELARTDPVAILAACMNRYENKVKGFRATLEKREFVAGVLHDREIIQIAVAGEVPDEPGVRPRTRVRMVWEKGFQKAGRLGLSYEVHGVLYPSPDNSNEMLTFRPDAFLTDYSIATRSPDARNASRYCVTDSGIYRGMLRTYTAWKNLKDRNELTVKYQGKDRVEKAGGRVCHIIRRTCTPAEVDSFVIGEKTPPAAANIDRDGFSEVTVMIDADRWLQVGTVLRRANGDLIGEYYFQNVEVVTEAGQFQPDTFTPEGMRAAANKKN